MREMQPRARERLSSYLADGGEHDPFVHDFLSSLDVRSEDEKDGGEVWIGLYQAGAAERFQWM